MGQGTPNEHVGEGLGDPRLVAFADAFPDGVMVCDAAGTPMIVNQAFAKLLGVPNAEAALAYVGPALQRLLVTGHQELARQLGRLQAGSPAMHVVVECKRQDGSVFPVDLQLASINAPALAPAALLITCRDVTEQRRGQAERQRVAEHLHHAQRLESLGVLAGGMAHDFNNLLVGVLGNASLALMDLSADAPARVAVQQIALAARRAAGLSQQMLAYSGRGAVAREPLRLSRLISELAQLLEATLPKNTRLELRLDAAEPEIDGDGAQLQQVVMNLISNASEAMAPRGGTVRVSVLTLDATELDRREPLLGTALAPGKHVCIQVEDSGVGMDATVRNRIFEPFFTTKATGRGMGLAAVLGVVRGHRGALQVGTTPGEGSAFRVFLPVSRGSRPTVASPAPVPSVPLVVRDAVVLLADDEEVVREVASRALERAGYTLIVASDGDDALAKGSERIEEIAIAILDLTMPGKTGAEVCEKLRLLRPDLPVLLSSGYSADEANDRFALLGLSGFVQKPYLPQELVDTVSRFVRPGRDAS